MTCATLLLALLAAPAFGEAAAEHRTAPTILDFTATWCGPCRQMKPVVELLAEKGYPVKQVDIDQSRELAERYRVEAVPTFVIVDSKGKELARTSGVRPANELARMYQEAKARLADASEPEPEADRPRKTPRTESDRGDEPAANPRPWETVVRIMIHNPGVSTGFGSGTIIHSTPEESIILTCAHIFHIEGARTQPHPKRFPRKISIDLFDGELRKSNENSAGMVHTAQRRIPGEAIDYDFTHDVGLIRIRPGRRLPATPVVSADWKPELRMPMITVGCSEGNDATAWSTHITNTHVGGSEIGMGRYEAVQCEHRPKQGRSGGGLYTTDGYLAGVCDFAEVHGNRGLYATSRVIHRILDKNNLTFCYNTEVERPGAGGSLLASREQDALRRRASNSDGKVRAQNTNIIPMPSAELVGARVPDEVAKRGDGIEGRRTPWHKSLASNSENLPFDDADEARPGVTRKTKIRAEVETAERPIAADIKMPPSSDDSFLSLPDEPAAEQKPQLPTAQVPRGRWRGESK